MQIIVNFIGITTTTTTIITSIIIISVILLIIVVVRSLLYSFITVATTIRIKRVIVDLHRAAMPRKSAHS